MAKTYVVNFPEIGEGVAEGEIIEWLKKEGEVLKQDDPVVSVMTDKATVELPSPYPGIMHKQHYRVGDMALRGKPLYTIELAPEVVVSEKKEAKITAPRRISHEKATDASPRVKSTPPVRKLAKDLGLNIEEIAGTGKEGEITQEDLHRAFAKKDSLMPLHPFSGDEEVPLRGVRNLMAQKMAESHSIIPQFSYFEQAEATRLIQLKQHIKEKAQEEKIQVTYMPFFIRALALTIQKYPFLNSSLEAKGRTLLVHKRCNIGIATSTSQGLVVPVLKDVQSLSLHEIIRSYEELKKRALEQKILPEDMKEATITVSNYGVLGGGGLWATPIINYPEVAILAVARINKQPLVKDGVIQVRDVLNLSWSFDHRVIDGQMGADCSHYFATLIQNPAQLL